MANDDFYLWLAKVHSTGDISPVRLGMSREELRELFGEPDDVGGTSRRQKLPMVWRYTDVEFHFGPRSTDGLNLIHREDQHGAIILTIPRRGTGWR